jgi:hypothetical protein
MRVRCGRAAAICRKSADKSPPTRGDNRRVPQSSARSGQERASRCERCYVCGARQGGMSTFLFARIAAPNMSIALLGALDESAGCRLGSHVRNRSGPGARGELRLNPPAPAALRLWFAKIGRAVAGR